jgi:hypothetical protein
MTEKSPSVSVDGGALRATLEELYGVSTWMFSQANDVIEDGAGNWSCIHCNRGGSGIEFTHAKDCSYVKAVNVMQRAHRILAAPVDEPKAPETGEDNGL